METPEIIDFVINRKSGTVLMEAERKYGLLSTEN
jgi:hypothetical protein